MERPMKLKNITSNMTEATRTMKSESFQKVGSALSAARDAIREEIQKETSDRIKVIIEKLENKGPINAADLDLVRLWIVGDAESYTKMENDFENWLTEFQRLQDEIEKMESYNMNEKDLFNAYGKLEDTLRLTYDIANFLENKERIQKFESAMGDGIDKGERTMLAQVLRRKLQSSDY
jgi:hypothetical protein